MRQQLVKFRTAQINGLRDLLAEYGEVLPQRRAGMRYGIAQALDRVSERLPAMVVDTLREQWARVAQLDEEVGRIERRLELWHPENAASHRIAEIPGVGLLGVTASVAAMGDPAVFRSGREFAAWLSLTPRHVCTGGRVRMLGISKRGDTYLRTLLIRGARSALTQGKAPPKWALRLVARRPPNVVIIALPTRGRTPSGPCWPMTGITSGTMLAIPPESGWPEETLKPKGEPPRVYRRQISVSQATMVDSSHWR